MPKLYQYVGPTRILEEARHQPPGFEVRTEAELRAWLVSHGVGRRQVMTVTFVVDEAGNLRVAHRRSEHVACSGGGSVRSAGELTLAMVGKQVRVADASNQSTGFCPEPTSWPEVQRALDASGIQHPGEFTSVFYFRRCPACGQTNIIKDEIFHCDACDAELPQAWNFED
jgi:hypothetical protein